MSKLTERLRDWCNNIRRKPSPIADAVPMAQEAADRIEHLERVLVQAREWVAERPEDRPISAGKLVAAIDEALQIPIAEPLGSVQR